MSNTTQPPADVRERVLTMLTAMEWAALVEHHDGRWYACCPWCGGENPDDDETPPGRAGHAERCELAAVIALLRAPRGEARRMEAIGREACDRPKGYASPGYDWNGVIGAGAVFTPKSTAIGQKAPESTDEEITDLFRQLIKDVANAAVLHAGWPNGADEPDRAVIDRRGEIAEYVAGYALEIEPPESLQKLLALLRVPRNDGTAIRVPDAMTRPCDCGSCDCGNTDEAWRVGYADGWNACRAEMLAAHDTTRPDVAVERRAVMRVIRSTEEGSDDGQ